MRGAAGAKISIRPVSLFSSSPAGKPKSHKAPNRMGYKGDGFNMSGYSLAMTQAVTITGSSRRMMPNGPSRVRSPGRPPPTQPPTETQPTPLPIYHHSSLCEAARHKHVFCSLTFE